MVKTRGGMARLLEGSGGSPGAWLVTDADAGQVEGGPAFLKAAGIVMLDDRAGELVRLAVGQRRVVGLECVGKDGLLGEALAVGVRGDRVALLEHEAGAADTVRACFGPALFDRVRVVVSDVVSKGHGQTPLVAGGITDDRPLAFCAGRLLALAPDAVAHAGKEAELVDVARPAGRLVPLALEGHATHVGE